MFFQLIIAAVLLLIVNINANTVAVYNTSFVNNNTTATTSLDLDYCSRSAFTAPNNTSMLFRQIHPKYRNITPVTGRSECEGFRKVDSKVDWDLLVEPTDREAFLQSLVGFEINDEDWTDVALKKAKGMQLFTLHAFFDRDEVEEFSNRTEVIGSRPNELRREPEDENASISTSLAYATRDYTPNLHNSNVTITEKNHSIHVIHTPDVLALWDAAEDTINFVKANPGKLCKFGKSLYDLVLARFKNRYMYADFSKLDDLRIFDRSRARISTTACSHSRATGNTEGTGAWILNLLEVGVNKRPEHCLSSINDKTSPDRLQSFYFTTVAEYIDYPEYIRRLCGHQFCYRKDSRWYDWLDYFRQLNETELQAQLVQQNLLIESSPVPSTERGNKILVLVEANAPRQSTRASSTSQGRRQSTRGSSTSEPLSISLDRKRKQTDDKLYPAIVSPFNSECLSMTTVAAPSVREWQLDSVLEDASRDEVRGMISLDFDDAFVVREFQKGGELYTLGVELRISVYKDLVAVDNNMHSEHNQLITYATWSWRAHHHMQNHCQGKPYLVPKTGADYIELRNFLNVMCGREIKCGTSFGERPPIGSPRYNLLLDIGMCPDPDQFAQLVEDNTGEAAAAYGKKKAANKPTRSDDEKASLLAMAQQLGRTH